VRVGNPDFEKDLNHLKCMSILLCVGSVPWSTIPTESGQCVQKLY